MKNKRPISIQGFDKTYKRFSKVVKRYFDNMFDVNTAFISNFILWNLDDINKRMLNSYKQNQFKKYSAYNVNMKEVDKNGDKMYDFKLSYRFDNDKLIFKLHTRYQSRYKRKIKFVLNIKKL